MDSPRGRSDRGQATATPRLSVTVMPSGGAPTKRAGHTLSVLKKVNGKWLLARDANMLAPEA